MDLTNFLTLRYDPTEKDTGYLRKLTYDDIHQARQTITSPKEIEGAIREAIIKCVNESSPKRISIALSTGVDSTLILSLIRDEFPNIDIHCVNVSFDQYSEATGAEKFAESKSSFFHSVVIDNPLRDLPHFISIVKEPRWNTYQYYFIERSTQFSKLLFTGDGGDELFGGYVFRYTKFLNSLGEKLSWEDKARLYLDCHNRDWVPDQAQMFGRNLRFNWKKIYLLFKDYFDNNLDPLDQVFMADYHGKLMYDFVPTSMKFFNHFNLTGGFPFLHPSVVDISIKIPPSSKYDLRRNIGKIPLRDLISKYDVRELSLEKKGFGMDLRSLWSRIAKDITISTLENGRIFEDQVINRDFYIRSLKRISDTQDIRYISKMLQLLSLEIWYKMFVTSEIGSNTSL